MVAEIYGLENQSGLQRLNSFSNIKVQFGFLFLNNQ